ncbi:MAG TPA: LPS assembly lipoprotein LptE [Burkholderiales bacterium]|nr:LPS assembly lipoprotein LptE [Burkholderiales bacterium]
MKTDVCQRSWSAMKAMNRFLRDFPSPLVPRPSSLVIATFLVAMTLSACGFQLRGQAAIPFQTVRVEAPGFSAFANDLERAIRAGSKTRIVESRDQAEAVVQIVGESQEKHILSLSSGGKVREFELLYRIAYRLTNRAGVDLALPGEIVLRRDMTYDDTVVLAKESEELLLFRDMKTDAVQQMLRRLSLVKPAT